MRWRVLLAAGAGLGVLIAGCGQSVAGTLPSPPHAGLLLAKSVDGGIAPSPVPLRAPDFALYGNGQVVESDRYRPTDARTAWLTDAGVRRLASRATRLGLRHGRVVHGSGQVADGQTLRLAFAHDGRRDTTTVEPMASPALQRFADDLSLDAIPRSELRVAPRPYAPQRVAAVTAPFTGPPGPPRDWPLAAPRAVPGLDRACATYGPADAKRALDLLDDRSRPVPWRVDGQVVRLIGLPLLPYETGCPDLARRP